MEKVEHRMNGKTQSHQSIALLIASRLSPSRRSGHYLSGARNVSFSTTSIELPRLREAALWLRDAASSSQGLQRPKPEEFGFELSNLYITKEDLVEVFCNKFKAEILKA
jgi:hypothetical protein